MNIGKIVSIIMNIAEQTYVNKPCCCWEISSSEGCLATLLERRCGTVLSDVFLKIMNSENDPEFIMT